MIIDDKEILSVLHLLWYGTSVRLFISKQPWTSHKFLRFWQWNCHHLFNELSLLQQGFKRKVNVVTNSAITVANRYVNTCNVYNINNFIIKKELKIYVRADGREWIIIKIFLRKMFCKFYKKETYFWVKRTFFATDETYMYIYQIWLKMVW